MRVVCHSPRTDLKGYRSLGIVQRTVCVFGRPVDMSSCPGLHVGDSLSGKMVMGALLSGVVGAAGGCPGAWVTGWLSPSW